MVAKGGAALGGVVVVLFPLIGGPTALFYIHSSAAVARCHGKIGLAQKRWNLQIIGHGRHFVYLVHFVHIGEHGNFKVLFYIAEYAQRLLNQMPVNEFKLVRLAFLNELKNIGNAQLAAQSRHFFGYFKTHLAVFDRTGPEININGLLLMAVVCFKVKAFAAPGSRGGVFKKSYFGKIFLLHHQHTQHIAQRQHGCGRRSGCHAQ